MKIRGLFQHGVDECMAWQVLWLVDLHSSFTFMSCVIIYDQVTLALHVHLMQQLIECCSLASCYFIIFLVSYYFILFWALACAKDTECLFMTCIYL